MKKFKTECIACGSSGIKITREHFWPLWLVELTRTGLTPVWWIPGHKVIPYSTTIPLCKRCNDDFNLELEVPAQRILRDVLAGRGLSANEAEVLVRWLWKFEGLAWRLEHPSGVYAVNGRTLRDRVLSRIDTMRSELVLAISLVERIDDGFSDEPMGLDSTNDSNAVFVAGVFSRVAIMSLMRVYSYGLPNGFTVIDMPALGAVDADSKLHFPRATFPTCTDAVVYMRITAPQLAHLHDKTFESMTRV
jgi:hypothetical protein